MNRALLVGIGLLLVPVSGRAEQRHATVTYVQKLQAKDGGFKATAAVPESSVRATSAALRTLKYLHGEVPDRSACVDFVKGCYDKTSGGFADRPGGKPDVATTAVGFMAAVELKLPTEPYEASVLKYLGENAKSFEEIRIAAAGCEALGKQAPQTEGWLREVAKARNADGSSGSGDGAARETGRVVATTLRLGGKIEDRDAVLKAMNDGQRGDGGFGKAGEKGSNLETCYQVMRAFHMLKAKPDAKKLTAFIASCRNADGGYGVSPGQPSSVPATYYSAIVLHWLAQK